MSLKQANWVYVVFRVVGVYECILYRLLTIQICRLFKIQEFFVYDKPRAEAKRIKRSLRLMTPQRKSMRITTLDICSLRVIMNEKPLNLEKATFSCFIYIVINLQNVSCKDGSDVFYTKDQDTMGSNTIAK